MEAFKTSKGMFYLDVDQIESIGPYFLPAIHAHLPSQVSMPREELKDRCLVVMRSGREHIVHVPIETMVSKRTP